MDNDDWFELCMDGLLIASFISIVVFVLISLYRLLCQ